ncbi:DUF58 domain-containing protein [Pseudomonas sp. 5P_3.1_Bac2]|uniref:DUF58 domain-containing protein n=1 Tax=Pseudomonas sp. 5P_3.1_Bac2 TaxID=2971617 RepID=UPI0021C730F1|nr:DUF58 domain-containing protein [Pseudomonas sp. 5P_3.1_Bac2]MCU1715695.1 DUF58 domain-containing protein [Pseudomonas sp. 5P_3.1_Bac2]
MKPARRLLLCLAWLFGLATLLGIASALGMPQVASVLPIFWALLLLLGLLGVVDALRLWRLPAPQVQRLLPGNLPLGRWSEIRLQISHDYPRTLQVEVFDHLPSSMQFEHLPLAVELRPGQHSQVGYRVRPLERGHWHFSHCEISLPSVFGLWQRRCLIAVNDETRVYPDFARLHGAQLMAVDHWVSQLGVRQSQRRGLGMEFHQLREFRDGDTLRQIDWKATARKRTPIAREYQDERDQQIIFLLDCGRRMRSQDGELSHFDHGLNACLLLSYVALRQGDAVGLATFASEQPRFLAPGKGQGQLSAMLNALYDLRNTQQPADFNSAVNQLLSRQRRRALVVLVTNLRDDDDQSLLSAVKRLGKQHRVLIASLREEVLDDLRLNPVSDFAGALDYCGALDYLNARSQLHERLTAQHVPVLDARPSELGPQMVSHYLAWKKAGVL